MADQFITRLGREDAGEHRPWHFCARDTVYTLCGLVLTPPPMGEAQIRNFEEAKSLSLYICFHCSDKSWAPFPDKWNVALPSEYIYAKRNKGQPSRKVELTEERVREIIREENQSLAKRESEFWALMRQGANLGSSPLIPPFGASQR